MAFLGIPLHGNKIFVKTKQTTPNTLLLWHPSKRKTMRKMNSDDDDHQISPTHTPGPTMDAEKDTNIRSERPGMRRTNASKPLTHIHFDSSDDVVATIDMPREEFTERWYTNSEYYVFRREATRACKKRQRVKQKDKLKDDNVSCYTGLDMVCDEALEARKLLVEKALDTVLRTQEVHGKTDGPSARTSGESHGSNRRSNNDNDINNDNEGRPPETKPPMDEAIARKYIEISCDTKARALKAAKVNENEAKEYCRALRADLVDIGVIARTKTTSLDLSRALHRLLRLKSE